MLLSRVQVLLLTSNLAVLSLKCTCLSKGSRCTGEAILAVFAQAQDADMQKSLPESFLQVAAAATLSAADHGVHSKEQATRRSRNLPDDAQMFADGFVVGLSFALQVSHLTYIAHLRHFGHAVC